MARTIMTGVPKSHSNRRRPEMLNPSGDETCQFSPRTICRCANAAQALTYAADWKCVDRSGDAVTAAFTSANAVAPTNMAAAKTATSRLPPMDASAAHVSAPFALDLASLTPGGHPEKCGATSALSATSATNSARSVGPWISSLLETRGRLVVVAIAIAGVQSPRPDRRDGRARRSSARRSGESSDQGDALERRTSTTRKRRSAWL